MDYITQIITNITDSFDFGFCSVVNILTYLAIKLIDEANGVKPITTWQKRFVLVIITITLGFIYTATGSDVKLIINSSILAPVFWSWICKPICNKFNIDYRKDIDILG